MKQKEFIVPLQALLAAVLCLGMGWLIYAMAFFNPSPPTPLDIQLRSTEENTVPNMSTVAALLTMLPGSIAAPPTAVAQATPTFAIPSTGGSVILVFTPFPLPLASPPISVAGTIFQPTPSPDPLEPTFVIILSPTKTFTPTNIPTLAPTLTDIPTLTPAFTSSPVPPTDTPTDTPVTPTDTPVPPTETPEPDTPTPLD